MYNELLKNKVQDSIHVNNYIEKLVTKLGNDSVVVDKIIEEIDDFLMENSEIYKFSNFKDLMYQSLLELDNFRFANFIRNVINNHPDKQRTYDHLLNDINSKLEEQYNLPKDYYHMTKSQLDDICDDLLLNENYFMLSKTRQFIIDNFRVFDYKSYIKENKDLALKILRTKDIDETNTTYLRIKKMLVEHTGYLGLFTYFHFIEKISFMRIKILFKNLIEHKSILRNLPTNIVDYMNQKLPYTVNGRIYNSNFERLEDDLTQIIDEHTAKLFANEYPLVLRRGLYKNPDYIEIIRKLTTDTPESVRKLNLYNTLFLKKVSKYKTQKELLDSLTKFVYTSNESENIEKIIERNSDLRLIFNDGELIIIRVLSHDALNEIANDTNWCICSSLSYWMDYVGDYNIQLVVVDLSTPETSIKRKIGITLIPVNNSSYRFNTAHYRNDEYITEDVISKLFNEHDIDIQTVYNISKNAGSNEQYSSSDIDDSESSRYNQYN